jgi:hypothetical protein
VVNKKKTLIKHAKRRAGERHGVNLHQDLLAKLVKQIQTGEAEYVSCQSRRVSKWLVTTPDGKRLPVVYDGNRMTIITVLPADHAEKGPKVTQSDPSKAPSLAGKR